MSTSRPPATTPAPNTTGGGEAGRTVPAPRASAEDAAAGEVKSGTSGGPADDGIVYSAVRYAMAACPPPRRRT